MNKRKILTFITALTMGLTSLSLTPAYVVAEEGNAEVSETGNYLVKKIGDIAFDYSSKYDEPSMYTGDEPNLDDIALRIVTYDNTNEPSILYGIDGFKVGSGLYSDLYTIDTSQVDNTQEGKYLITLKPKADASLKASSPYNTDYDITLKGKGSYKYLTVYDKEKIKDTPLYLRFYTADIEIPCTHAVGIELVGAMASDVRYEIEDETIAQIRDDSNSKYLELEALKPGETTVNVYTSDGRKTSEKVRVVPLITTTQPKIITTTTAPDPNVSTTRRTTTTVVTVDKWWYGYETHSTTTAVRTVPATTSTVIYDYMPTVELDKSPMTVGETRTGRLYNPETKKTEGGSVYSTSDAVSIDYTKGSDTFKITALKAGKASITFSAKGCAFNNYVDLEITGEDVLLPDFAPMVDFDTADMKVGETRDGRFYSPVSNTSTGGSIKASDNVSVKVEKDGSFKVTALKAGLAGLEITDNGCPFVAHVSFNVTDFETTAVPSVTTTTEPEVWRWGTGVDHFDSIKTQPTKTIYNEGEDLDLSGLVINAYHSATKYSNKGRAETVRTDYVWEIEEIKPEYISIQDLSGKTVAADKFSTLKGGNAYIVNFGKDDVVYDMKITGNDNKKIIYDTAGFSFKVYINSPDSKSKFINIDNAEVESFEYSSTGSGFKIKGMDSFSIDMDAHMWAGYSIESGIRKGDIVSGVLYIASDRNYVILGDLEVVKYGGEAGDANADGTLDMADVVMIMQALANPNKYGLGGSAGNHITERGKVLGDMDGDGLTVGDAQKIQMKLLNIKASDDSEKYPFEAEYVRVYATGSYNREPVIEKFDSEEEFLKRFNSNSENSKYNEKWFSEHKLILITLEEGSGSVRHKVTELTADHVAIDRITSEVMTCDWAVWHIYIELDKDAAISDDFRAVITETEDSDA